MKREPKGVGYGPPCPTDYEHGRLLDGEWSGWYCPHIDHRGRPRTHPDGEAAPSHAFFTNEDIGW